jgi:uncharacterized RDD family membrane protein YckC
MLCPSCGAIHSSKQCPESATGTATDLINSWQYLEAETTDSEEPDFEATLQTDLSSIETKSNSRLIEFPGVSRRSMPQWRKELSERVREVQERRAREAAAEAEAAARLKIEQPHPPTPQLELLPQSELPPVNPVVAAALRRIERAHQSLPAPGYSRAATAVAMAPDTVPEGSLASSTAPARKEMTAPDDAADPAQASERTHNLVMVQPPVPSPAEPDSEKSPNPEKPRPKRTIGDDLNDPALSYLDSIGLASGPFASIEDRAPLWSRFAAAVIDLFAVGFLSLPFAAAIELQNGNWHQPRVVSLMLGIAAVIMFAYATVSTALTGRTLGMKLLSLRAIDVRTGLIPTGKQSAGRALVYVLSVGTMGLGLLMAFARGEGKTAHDRFSRTAVVRD